VSLKPSVANRKKFDLDLEFGNIGEEFVNELFQGGKRVEVKTERDRWSTTGNIVIEFRSYGKPSGVEATEASYWVHLLSLDGSIVGGYIFNVANLRYNLARLYDSNKIRSVCGGDNKASFMYIVPLSIIPELQKGILNA